MTFTSHRQHIWIDLQTHSTHKSNATLPKLPASVINLDFLKIAHENRDTSPTLAGGGPKKAILGCLHSTSNILMYNACRVSSHSALLIRNIIYNLNVGRSRVPSLRLLKDTDLLTTPRTSYIRCRPTADVVRSIYYVGMLVWRAWKNILRLSHQSSNLSVNLQKFLKLSQFLQACKKCLR